MIFRYSIILLFYDVLATYKDLYLKYFSEKKIGLFLATDKNTYDDTMPLAAQ